MVVCRDMAGMTSSAPCGSTGSGSGTTHCPTPPGRGWGCSVVGKPSAMLRTSSMKQNVALAQAMIWAAEGGGGVLGGLYFSWARAWWQSESGPGTSWRKKEGMPVAGLGLPFCARQPGHAPHPGQHLLATPVLKAQALAPSTAGLATELPATPKM